MKILKKINLKVLIIVFLVLVLVLGYFGYNKFLKNPEIISINSIAAEYFKTYKNYGFEARPGDLKDCFSQNIFLRNAEIDKIFAAQDVTDISCKFKIEGGIVTAYSVSLIKDTKVFCADSSGNNMETPGITTTSNCKAE